MEILCVFPSQPETLGTDFHASQTKASILCVKTRIDEKEVNVAGDLVPLKVPLKEQIDH